MKSIFFLIVIFFVVRVIVSIVRSNAERPSRRVDTATSGRPRTPQAALPPPATLDVDVDATPDTPQPFGYKIAWLAVHGGSGPELASALDLADIRPANWQSGIRLAYGQGDLAFISPPIEGWSLVVCGGLPSAGYLPDRPRWNALMSSLAARFDHVQHFATHRVVEAHSWSRWDDGVETRTYAYLGESGETLADRGDPTDDELALGHAFFDERSPEAQAEGDGYFERDDLTWPDEEDVMNVAGVWSLDPQSLADLDVSPGVGWIGRLPRGGA